MFLAEKNIDINGKNLDTQKLDSTYFKKIKAFQIYLNIKHKHELIIDWKKLLSGLKENDIKNSMEMYIEKSRKSDNSANYVNKRCVLITYSIIINEFLRFLSSSEIKNIYLLHQFDLWDDDPASFKRIINSVSRKYNLDDKISPMEPLDTSEFDTLLQVCNKYLSIYSIDEMLENESKYLRFTRSLIIKLMLFTGIRCTVLSSIKASDYKRELNLITINNLIMTGI